MVCTHTSVTTALSRAPKCENSREADSIGHHSPCPASCPFSGDCPQPTCGHLHRPFSARVSPRLLQGVGGKHRPAAPQGPGSLERPLRRGQSRPGFCGRRALLPAPSSASRPAAPSLRRRLDQSSGISCSGAAPPAEPPRARPSAPSSPHGRSAAGGDGPGRRLGGGREGPGQGPGEGSGEAEAERARSVQRAAGGQLRGPGGPRATAPRPQGLGRSLLVRDSGRRCGAVPQPVAPGAPRWRGDCPRRGRVGARVGPGCGSGARGPAPYLVRLEGVAGWSA